MEAMRCVAMKKQFPIISFEHASFQYEGQSQESLKDVKLIIKSGEFLVITGQSGCGKTTLTRCINNLIPHFFEGRLSGEVIVSGRSIKESDAGEAGKEIASIFQDPRSQFFTTNSSSEVAFACENYGIPHKEIVKRVNSAFQSLNMENLKDRDIFALSSGERQKVAFLAATTLNPQIYVLDEPSANLDIHTILQVRGILSALKAAGHTIIVSEHRLFYLYGLADHFLIMEDGQICEELTGEEFAIVYIVLLVLAQVLPIHLSSVITFFLLRILTIALALNILFQTTEISELIAALQASHIPQAIVIPVAIILRFLPSLKQDVLYIKQGMKTRGVGLSFWRIVSHPAQTYEGFLIPILMRLLMTATELSASAETRGISYPCEKTHYILVDFRLRDSILLIGMLALFAVVIWTSFQPISF